MGGYDFFSDFSTICVDLGVHSFDFGVKRKCGEKNFCVQLPSFPDWSVDTFDAHPIPKLASVPKTYTTDISFVYCNQVRLRRRFIS